MSLQVLELDYQELKNQLPAARIAGSNGKVYISVELPGKLLAVENGKILVDGVPVGKLLAELFQETTGGKKNTGGR